MFRSLARCSATHIRHQGVPSSQKALKPGIILAKPLRHARRLSDTSDRVPAPDRDPGCPHQRCYCRGLRDETAGRAAKLRALGAEAVFPDYDPLDHKQVSLMEDWYAKGPPPLCEYRLSFGKHKGKRLQDVPDVYFVKYLIPRRDGMHYQGNVKDYIVVAALDEHLKNNPGLKSQAGRGKAKVREGGIEDKPKRKQKVHGTVEQLTP